MSVVEVGSVDPADAGHQTVGRRALDQLLHRSSTPLGGDGQRPVLGEAAGVAEVVDVLSAPSVDPAGDGVRPPRADRRRVRPAGARAAPRGPVAPPRCRRSASGGPPGCRHRRPRPRPGSSPTATSAPASTSTARTTPATGDRTTCSIFMDSRISRVAPSATTPPVATGTSTTVPGTGATTVRREPGAGAGHPAAPSDDRFTPPAWGRCWARRPPTGRPHPAAPGSWGRGPPPPPAPSGGPGCPRGCRRRVPRGWTGRSRCHGPPRSAAV